MNKIAPWIHASRPRTLPLALSSTILASFLAAAENKFNWKVFFLASSTTVLLQILSNLANDYGDFTKGTDSGDRIGPQRMVQSGQIKPRAMIVAISLVITLALISGSLLIYFGTTDSTHLSQVILFLLGIAAIFAAVKYTVGKNPYGYKGFGDLFVFIFFGLIGVLGTYYLHTHQLKPLLILPATSIGLLSAGVLNLNNLRDFQSDKTANKKTLVVILGNQKAKIYHLILIVGAILAVLFYTLLEFRSLYQFLFLVPVPFLLRGIWTVFRNTQPAELNPELRKLALSTLLFSLAFGLGLMIH